MAQGLCLVSIVLLGNHFVSNSMIGCFLTFWYGYYKLCAFIVALIVANVIYLIVNFERIASTQLRASVIDENYRFVIDKVIENDGDTSEEMQRRRRAYGAVIGAFVGDAAGAVLEFNKRRISEEDVEWALRMEGGGENDMGGGQITDDSEMAMCIMHGLSDGSSEEIVTAASKMNGKRLESEE